MVYNPNGAPAPLAANNEPANDPNNVGRLTGYQVGYMRSSGDVETTSSPAANNVNQLVQTVMLNYMSLNGEAGQFDSRFSQTGENGAIQGSHGLGSAESRERLIAFGPLS